MRVVEGTKVKQGCSGQLSWSQLHAKHVESTKTCRVPKQIRGLRAVGPPAQVNNPNE